MKKYKYLVKYFGDGRWFVISREEMIKRLESTYKNGEKMVKDLEEGRLETAITFNGEYRVITV